MAALPLALALAAACNTAASGLAVGQACDPTLSGRDCQEGLICAYSYDDCPQYGCPMCRRPCRQASDCNQAESRCSSQPACQQQQELEDRGVCQVCEDTNPWEPAPWE